MPITPDHDAPRRAHEGRHSSPYSPEPDLEDTSPPGVVIEEVVDESYLDEWTPDFPIGELATVLPQHRRVDSRRWLLLPDRYLVRPLRGLAAAEACDGLAASPHGKALLALEVKLRRQREGLLELTRDDLRGARGDAPRLPPDEIEEQAQADVDARLGDYARVAVEELVGEAQGFRPYAWAREWLQRCDARRVPLPSRQGGERPDVGGPVVPPSWQKNSAWLDYYAERQVHLLRLAACCAWLSIAPFFDDLRPSR